MKFQSQNKLQQFYQDLKNRMLREMERLKCEEI